MTQIGTPLANNATRILLLGSGELGKEVAIEFQRLGCEVIACDAYDNAPAMQVAHRRHIFSMLDDAALRQVVEMEKPDYIVPEVEAIATETLIALEQEGVKVVPSANATAITMNRERIRTLAAETLSLPTSRYRFAQTLTEFEQAVAEIGYPCFVKPIMSSSGKGQSLLRQASQLQQAWDYAQAGGRAGAGKVIVEGMVDFDFEITLLTTVHVAGTSFCEPIGHRQQDGDYRESWQPQAMSPVALSKAQEIAAKVTNALGGYGLFGVELFIKGDDVIFSEVSPRPHDTGMVTMISQDLSEFALHTRAILGLPLANIHFHGPSASSVLMVEGHSTQISYQNLATALTQPDTQLRLFGKPEVAGARRMGVALARDENVDLAKAKAIALSQTIQTQCL